MANNFSFGAFDGDVTLKGIADLTDTSLLRLNCSTSLIDVDIRKMFKQLNNFGQSIVEDKNLQGKSTAQIDFSANWNEQLVCDLSSIQSSADIVISKGELI